MDASSSCIKGGGLLSKTPELDVVQMGVGFSGNLVGFLGLRLFRRTKIRAVHRDGKRKRSRSPLSQDRQLKIRGQAETVAMDAGLPVPGRPVQKQQQL